MQGMRHRRKILTPPASLYDEAYQWQHGEFYPEHHQANVQRLHKKYPGHSISEIDEIYRQACRIDYEVQQQVGKSHLSRGAREELREWLERHYHGLSRQSFLWAIEKASPDETNG